MNVNVVIDISLLIPYFLFFTLVRYLEHLEDFKNLKMLYKILCKCQSTFILLSF